MFADYRSHLACQRAAVYWLSKSRFTSIRHFQDLSPSTPAPAALKQDLTVIKESTIPQLRMPVQRRLNNKLADPRDCQSESAARTADVMRSFRVSKSDT